MDSVIRDIELTYVPGTGYYIRTLNPGTGSVDADLQYGPLPQDDVEEQLLAIGISLDDAAPLIVNATKNAKAVLKGQPSPPPQDANAW